MKGYHFYLISFLLFTGLLLFTSPAQAEKKEVFIVDTPSLTVRSEPAATSEPIGYLKSGDKVSVFETKYGWAKSYFNNQEGWIAAQYLHSAPFSNMNLHNKMKKITIEGEGVRIRSGPGTGYPIYFISPNQAAFELVSSSNGWRQILLEDGTTGWVASWLTSDREEAVKSEEKVLPLEGHTILLDAGHGGKDPGAIALDNTYEKQVTLTTAQKTAEVLEESGATVLMTREEDATLSLDRRVEISNESLADIFISFHYNSSLYQTMNGVSTFYYGNKDSHQQLAASLQNSLLEYIQLSDRGIRKADFRVLRNNEKPAVLLELGFLSNPQDLAAIHTNSFQENTAKAVTEALINYFKEK